MSRYLVTSALPYANGKIHLGHIAGAYLPADIYCRFTRLKGKEVLYVCGSDEHGAAITISADIENTSPKNIIDKYHFSNKDSFEKFGISFDNYSRTSLPLHHDTARDFFSKLLKNGFLSEKTEKQFFDSQKKLFLPDRYILGTCPNCGNDNARGDQCEKCGAHYDQTELINPMSVFSNTTPVLKQTSHFYFKLDMFQEFLESYIDSNQDSWRENVVQQTRNWLKQGLRERAVTRDLSWGVSIDGIEGLDTNQTKDKVLYVWFEAVLGYITSTKEWAIIQSEKNKDISPDEWKKWWTQEDTEYISFIGKDNIVFHTLMFPAILMAYGGFILPTNVPANEFLNLEGQKFSKSRNWSIDISDLLLTFDSSRIDAMRYTLATILPENRDADFTWKDFQNKNNNELASILGNYVNRVLQFIMKNFDSKVPVLSDEYSSLTNALKQLLVSVVSNTHHGQTISLIVEKHKEQYHHLLSDNDYALYLGFASEIQKIIELYSKFKIKEAVGETMNLARLSNKYFNDEQPWITIKTDINKCNKTIFLCVQSLYVLSVLFAPIIPFTSCKIQKLFGKTPVLGDANNGVASENFILQLLSFTVQPGSIVKEPEILFSRIEDSEIEEQKSKLGR